MKNLAIIAIFNYTIILLIIPYLSLDDIATITVVASISFLFGISIVRKQKQPLGKVIAFVSFLNIPIFFIAPLLDAARELFIDLLNNVF